VTKRETTARSERDRKPWIAIRIENLADRESVMSALFAAGSQGIQEDGDALVTHFPPGTDAESIRDAVRAADPAATVHAFDAPVVDWSEWRASVRAHRLGKLTVLPPWLADKSDPMQVVIEPAMAFGTGEHATTRGVVRLMQQLDSMPAMVADIGAGSAVLAICAVRLGATQAVAIELDNDAIANAEENVVANGVEGVVHVIEGDAAVLLPLVAPVGLVLANIISSVLIELLPVIHDSLTPSGYAILSGILVEERERMLEEIDRGQWKVASEYDEEGWWSVLIERQP
jgi:ribosomal protein L11 methyltransferase